MEYTVTTMKDRPDLADEINRLYKEAWPKFVSGEKVMNAYWGFMSENFPDHHLLLLDGDEILAVVNSAAFHLGDEPYEVSSDGLYWGLKKISHDICNNRKPDNLMALQVIVNPRYMGKGISYYCIKEMKKLASEMGYSNVFIPLRPSKKYLYPLMPLNEYINIKDEYGIPYDPWLRVNVKLGGEIMKPCRGIMIKDTIEQWEKWTEMKFPFDGKYIVPFAMSPVDVELSKNQVTYIQENVWIRHRIKNS